MAGYQGQIISLISDRIENVAHVSHIRIQKPTFTFDPTNIYFVATMIDVPDPIGE